MGTYNGRRAKRNEGHRVGQWSSEDALCLVRYMEKVCPIEYKGSGDVKRGEKSSDICAMARKGRVCVRSISEVLQRSLEAI